MDSITVDEALRLVTQYGSIDEAGRNSPWSVGAFRKFCRAHGISARRQAPIIITADGVSREAMLTQELTELRRQVKQLSTQAVRDERIVDAFVNAFPAAKPRYTPARLSTSKKQTKHQFVLLFSDLHAGEVVSPEVVGGANDFNYDVLLKRMDWLADVLVSFKQHRPYQIEALRIASLGDIIGGSIHQELATTNELPDVDVTIEFAHDFARWIEGLIPEFPKITIDCTSGNHGRIDMKMPAKLPQSNFDYIWGKFVQQLVSKFPSVTVNVPRSYFVPVDIYGRTMLLWHGDGVRSSGGVPLAGVIRRAKQLDEQFAHLGKISHHAVGHFHTGAVAENGRILMNPSLKGADEWVLKALGGGSAASQLLTVHHPVFGMTEHAFLHLQHRPELP